MEQQPTSGVTTTQTKTKTKAMTNQLKSTSLVTSQNVWEQAEELVSIARERLILTQPFYSSILMNLEDTFLDAGSALARGISTMATDGHQVFFNAPAVAQLHVDVVEATLVEEVIHVCHLHHVRMVGLDGPTFNVAADIRIAADLKLEGYTLNPQMLGAQPQFAKFQDKDQYDAEAIYWAILEDTDEDQDQTDEDQQEDQEEDQPTESTDEPQEDQPDDEGGSDDSGAGPEADDDGQGDGAADQEGGDEGPEADGGSGQPGDDADDGGDGDAGGDAPAEGPGSDQEEGSSQEGQGPTQDDEGPGQASQAGLMEDEEDHVGQTSMGGVLPMNEDGHVDAASLAQEQERIHDMIIQAHRAAKGMGLASGFGLQMFEAILQPRDDVARVLDQMLQQCRSHQTTWSRPNRRHIHSGLYLPGQGKDKKLNILLGFDVSGSMGDDDYKVSLDLAWGVLSAYDVERVDLAQVDTRVVKFQTIEEGDDVEICQTRRGFGGSNMTPFFELIEKADEDGQPYDLAVLFTDGGVMWPTQEPDIPCLNVFVGTYLASQDAPIGTTVRLEK